MKASLMERMGADPEAAARRLMQRAHNRDGLPEIAIGAFLLAVAFLIWLQVAYWPGSPAYRASWWGMMLGMPILIGGAPWAIRRVRQKFLMNKVGYVELKPISKKLRLVVACVAFVVAGVLVWAVYRRAVSSGSWLLAGTGIAWGSLAVYAGRLPRYVVGGVLMAVVGMGLAVSGFSFERGSLILYGSMGLLSLTSGCVVLVRFVRIPQGDGD
jgi:hypothetical protein